MLSTEDLAFLETLREHLRERRLLAADDRDGPATLERSGLPKQFWGLALTVYQPGHQRLMVVRAGATPAFENVRRAVAQVLAHPRFPQFDFADRTRCRLQVDFIVDEPVPVEWSSLSGSSLDGNRFEIGIDGLRIAGPGKRRYVLPGDAFVWSILSLNQLRRHIARLFRGVALEDLQLYRFQSASYVSTAAGWIRLVRGYPAVSRVTQESLFRAAEAGVDWIVRNQQPDGRFLYYYDAATDSRRDHEHPQRNPETDPYYNLLRHCGGVITALLYWDLCYGSRTGTLARREEDDGQECPSYNVPNRPREARSPIGENALRHAAEAGIDFCLRQVVPYVTSAGQDAAYAYFNRKAKLGGSGLGLYMLALHQNLFRDDTYANAARRLAWHLVSEILDTGEFMYYHIYLDQRVSRAANRAHFSFYYPGEAIVGLANYCAHVCQSPQEKEAIYARVHAALRFLILDRPRLYAPYFASLPSDSWLMMGINDLWDEPQFRQELYRQFVFQDADQMVAHLYTPRRALYPDYVGSFYYQYGDHPYPDGARAEGLTAAYRLARKTGDPTRIERYRAALQHVAWATLRLCNTPDSVYSVPNPERAIGGIRFKFTRQWFRVDTIQHVASFFMKFLPVWEASFE
jgi:hypothetical protein